MDELTKIEIVKKTYPNYFHNGNFKMYRRLSKRDFRKS